MQQIALKPTVQGLRSVSFLSFSICLGAFVFSYNTVCLTQIAQLFKQKNHLTKQQFVKQLSIATSAFNLGGLLSPIFYRKFVKIFGQLKGLLIIDMLGICAILASLIQLEFYVLTAARFFLGILIGLSSAIMPPFVNSIAPLEQVGKLGAFNQLLQTLALVSGYTAGYLVQDIDVNDEIRWRIYLGIPILIFIFRIVSLQLYFRFQTLQRHIENNQIQEIGRYCLMTYGNDSEQTIQAVISLKSFKKLQTQYSSTFRIRFIVALTAIAANQLSGTNAINYYAKQLFNKITDDNTQLSQILIIVMSLFQVFGMLCSTIIIDKVGRKNLILKGQILIGIFLFSIFIFNKFLDLIFGNHFANYGIIVLIFMHLFTMNVTMGPCCAIYATQIIQDITWAIILMKSFTFLIAITTEYMIQYMGVGFMFLIFFCLTLITHVFLRKNMRETKGKNTQQIYSSFKSYQKNSEAQNYAQTNGKQSLLQNQQQQQHIPK